MLRDSLIKDNMYQFEYQLNDENLTDYNLFMAMHNKQLQNRLIQLMVVFMLPFGLMIYFFRPISIFISIALLGLVFDAFLLPKFYWKIIKKNADQQVSSRNIQYQKIDIELADTAINVNSANQLKVIRYANVDSISFTNLDCFVVYDEKESLIIPLQALSDQTTEILAFLHDKLPDKLKG